MGHVEFWGRFSTTPTVVCGPTIIHIVQCSLSPPAVVEKPRFCSAKSMFALPARFNDLHTAIRGFVFKRCVFKCFFLFFFLPYTIFINVRGKLKTYRGTWTKKARVTRSRLNAISRVRVIILPSTNERKKYYVSQHLLHTYF